MPTLSEQIAALTTQTQALVDGVEAHSAQIDASVAAALAAVPTNARVYYVATAANGGNDAADGSVATPLATIEEAISRTPLGGRSRVLLARSQTHHLGAVDATYRAIHITAWGDAATSEATLPNATAPLLQVDGRVRIGGGSLVIGSYAAGAIVETTGHGRLSGSLDAGGSDGHCSFDLVHSELRLLGYDLVADPYQVARMRIRSSHVDAGGGGHLHTTLADSTLQLIVSSSSTTAASWTDLLVGVTRATDGEPTNVQSNIAI